MKTFFWTSVVWMLGLVAFWCAGNWTTEGRDLWFQILPEGVKASLAPIDQEMTGNGEENAE